MARAVSCSQPTLPMGSGDMIASVPMKMSLYGALIKFSSDPFGESRATWFVFSFYRVMYCLLSIVVFNVPILCGVSVVSLVDTIFVRSMFHFQDILFSLRLLLSVLKLYHPKVRVMSAVWRSKTRPDIGTSFRANFGFIRRCFHCLSPRRNLFREGFLSECTAADTHAVEYIGAVVVAVRTVLPSRLTPSLAVLHNRNDITTLFRARQLGL